MWTGVNELTTTVLKAEKRYLRTWPESSPKLELTPGRLQGDNFAVMEISSVPLVPETFPTARGLRPTPKHPTARETQTSGTHSYNLMAVLFQELMRSFQLEMRTSVLPRLLVALREVFWLFQSWTSRQTHGIYNCQALQQHCLQSKE